jgi:hypothetical protein
MLEVCDGVEDILPGLGESQADIPTYTKKECLLSKRLPVLCRSLSNVEVYYSMSLLILLKNLPWMNLRNSINSWFHA